MQTKEPISATGSFLSKENKVFGMTGGNTGKPPDYDDNLQNARIGYQVAVNLWEILNQAHWARFSSMVVANSIIIGMIGLILTTKSNNIVLIPIFAVFMSIIGIFLTILWYRLMSKDFKDMDYYIACARVLEDEYLYPAETVLKHTPENGKNEYKDISYLNLFDFKFWTKCNRTRCFIIQIISIFWATYVVVIFATLAIWCLQSISNNNGSDAFDIFITYKNAFSFISVIP